MRLEPTNIQQIGNELAIQWNDGIESYLDLQFPISSTVVAARDADMKRATKSLIVLLCASLCAGGTMLSLKERASDHRHKTKVVPINNRQSKRASWILV